MTPFLVGTSTCIGGTHFCTGIVLFVDGENFLSCPRP